MKYNTKTKMLEFSSDDSVSRFHDQLTEIMRFAMSNVGNSDLNNDDALKVTQEFFTRYSSLSDTLKCLRAHLPRGDIR